MVDYKKILFLWLDPNDYLALQTIEYGVVSESIYKDIPLIFRILRRAQVKANIPGISLWLSSWKKELCRYEVVIIHASRLTPPVVRFIKRLAPGIRIIVWYWNPVEKSVNLDAFPKEYCEVWSFDELDCLKYSIKQNTQFYFKTIKLPEIKPKYDVFFVGRDKGRLNKLLDIKQHFEGMGISNYFHITPDRKKNLSKRYFYKNNISYIKVLDYIAESRAILDIVSERQSGLTIRPLEALFLNKKLITNDVTIKKRDFFLPENIFILGDRDIKELPSFLCHPHSPVNESISDRYDFKSWICRFF